MKESFVNAEKELKEAKAKISEISGESIPHVVETMKKLGKLELNVSDLPYEYDFCVSGYYYTGWDEGQYEPMRLFVYDDRLYLIGRNSYEYEEKEFPQSTMNLSSSDYMSDVEVYNLLQGLIPHLLNENDEIYTYTEFDEDYQKATISEIEKDFVGSFSSHDRVLK